MMILKKKLQFNSRYYKNVLTLLNYFGGNARIVGGAVRDALLNKHAEDVDIITSISPEKVREICKNHAIKFKDDGYEYGTVIAFYKGEKFEITTLRCDLECDGRYAKVVFTNSFQEDAARRDFTINALSYCPFKMFIYDYFNGIEDIFNKKVIFIGNPEDRIREDFLRILRFFRFSCYYAIEVDSNGLAASLKLKHNLINLSKERVKIEIDKLVDAKMPKVFLQTMFNHGILQLVLPFKSFNFESLELANKVSKKFGLELQLATKYSLMLYCNNKLTQDIFLSIRFTKRSSKEIIELINFIKIFRKLSEKLQFFLIRRLWVKREKYLDYLISVMSIELLSNDSNVFRVLEKHIRILDIFNKPTLPIKANDLIQAGVETKKLGKCLKMLENYWIYSNFTLNKTQLIDLLSFIK